MMQAIINLYGFARFCCCSIKYERTSTHDHYPIAGNNQWHI